MCMWCHSWKTKHKTKMCCVCVRFPMFDTDCLSFVNKTHRKIERDSWRKHEMTRNKSDVKMWKWRRLFVHENTQIVCMLKFRSKFGHEKRRVISPYIAARNKAQRSTPIFFFSSEFSHFKCSPMNGWSSCGRHTTHQFSDRLFVIIVVGCEMVFGTKANKIHELATACAVFPSSIHNTKGGKKTTTKETEHMLNGVDTANSHQIKMRIYNRQICILRKFYNTTCKNNTHTHTHFDSKHMWFWWRKMNWCKCRTEWSIFVAVAAGSFWNCENSHCH